MAETSNTNKIVARKIYRIEVGDKLISGDDALIDIVYVAARHKNRAERMAILASADNFSRKTSELYVMDSKISDKKLASQDFFLYVAVLKEDIEEENNDTESLKG